MITLPTKTVGVSARASIRVILPSAKTMKKVAGSFVLRDADGVMLGHVNEGNRHSPKAVLVLAK